jgi:RNA polymerase sigma-70 factor (ECF subfamily)
MTRLLAERLREDRSLERIFRHHAGDVYRYALALLREPRDAEEVTHTTFLNAHRALRGGASPRTAQSWLIDIAHDVCRYRSGDLVQHESREEELDERRAVPTVGDVRRAITALPYRERTALVLHDLDHIPCREIALLLGVPTSAAEAYIFQGRRELRELLERSLTCAEAELAISRHLDGLLEPDDETALGAHLRGCPACSELARTQRLQRAAIRALAEVPLPQSLASYVAD